MIIGKIVERGSVYGTVVSDTKIIGSFIPPQSVIAETDHEVITIDRYLLHDQVISPISENAIVSMTSNETSTNIISPVNSLSSSEIQTETYILTPVEGNFEEDIEL